MGLKDAWSKTKKWLNATDDEIAQEKQAKKAKKKKEKEVEEVEEVKENTKSTENQEEKENKDEFEIDNVVNDNLHENNDFHEFDLDYANANENTDEVVEDNIITDLNESDKKNTPNTSDPNTSDVTSNPSTPTFISTFTPISTPDTFIDLYLLKLQQYAQTNNLPFNLDALNHLNLNPYDEKVWLEHGWTKKDYDNANKNEANKAKLLLYLNEYNEQLHNKSSSSNLLVLFQNNLKALNIAIMKEFIDYQNNNLDVLYKKIVDNYPISTISDSYALSFYQIYKTYSNYDWSYLKNNLFANYNNVLHTLQAGNNKFQLDINNFSLEENKVEQMHENRINYFNHLDLDALNYASNELNTQERNTYINPPELTANTSSIASSNSFLPIYLYDDTTKNNIWIINFILDKIVIATYLNDLFTNTSLSGSNYSIVSIDIYKQNLIKQIILHPTAKEWLVFNLFHQFYPLKAGQLSFSWFMFEYALSYYDLHFDDLILYCSLYFTNMISPAVFMDINTDNVNNVWYENIPNNQRKEVIIANQPPILKTNIFLKNSETNLKQLLVPQGSILPLKTTSIITPLNSAGKFGINVLLQDTPMFLFDFNLNDVNFLADPNLYLSLEINNTQAVFNLKYAISEKQKANDSTTTYITKQLIVSHPFKADLEDCTHFNYVNLLNASNLFELKNLDLFSNELLKKPFVFNDILAHSISSGNKLLQQDLLYSFAYALSYNQLNPTKKFNLQGLLFYYEQDSSLQNNQINLWTNSRSFNEQKVTDTWDSNYLTRGLNFSDASFLVKHYKHKMRAWRWKLNQGSKKEKQQN